MSQRNGKRAGRTDRRPTKPSLVPEERTRKPDGTRICGAKRRDGTPCQTTFLQPNGRCRMHGGGALKGLASPSFKDGRFAKDLPPRLQARFEEAVNDQELLSLRKDAALLDAMLTAKLSELREAEMNPDLEQITTLVDRIAREWAGWDWTTMNAELQRLKDSISARQSEGYILSEVRALIREKASVVSQENKRLADLDQNMTAEQAMLLVQALVGVVRRELADLADAQPRMRAIAAGFRDLATIKEV